VALTKSGKDLIVPIFRKHSAEIARMFADANPKELQILEAFSKRPASAPVRWLRKGPSRTTRPGVASHSLELRRFKQLLRGVMQRLEQNMIEPAHATNFERFEDQKNPRKRWRFLLNRKAALKTRDIVCLN